MSKWTFTSSQSADSTDQFFLDIKIYSKTSLNFETNLLVLYFLFQNSLANLWIFYLNNFHSQVEFFDLVSQKQNLICTHQPMILHYYKHNSLSFISTISDHLITSNRIQWFNLKIQIQIIILDWIKLQHISQYNHPLTHII